MYARHSVLDVLLLNQFLTFLRCFSFFFSLLFIYLFFPFFTPATFTFNAVTHPWQLLSVSSQQVRWSVCHHEDSSDSPR